MSWLTRDQLAAWQRWAQFAAVLLCAFALKLYYSNASANQLRWILAPTTALVELVSGGSFAFESNAGYLSGDRTFLIAPSCAGVNFLITSFLMLALVKLWRDRSSSRSSRCPAKSGSSTVCFALFAKAFACFAVNVKPKAKPQRAQSKTQSSAKKSVSVFKLHHYPKSNGLAWSFIPLAALVAYLATIVANTARISIALWLRDLRFGNSWLSANQLHRLEGIVVYFGFLLLLFVISERLSSRSLPAAVSLKDDSQSPPHAGRLRGGFGLLGRLLFPLLVYYATALGIPLANSAYHGRIAATDFWEHSLFVLLAPLLLVLILAAFRLYSSRRSRLRVWSADANQTRPQRRWRAIPLRNRSTQPSS